MPRLSLIAILLFLPLATLAQDAPVAPPDSLTALTDGKGTLAPVTRLEHPLLNECSGLVWHDGAWWAHNDSGDGPFLFRSETLDFKQAARLAVPGAKAVDWEELTVFQGDLLVCDIGDNARRREDATLYRVKYEPPKEEGDGTLKLVATYPVTWPDGPHDCEAAFTIDGKLHLVTKQRGEGFTGLYQFAELKAGEVNTPALVAKLDVGASAMITAGTFDAASGNVMLLSYTRVYVYPKDKLEGKPAFSTLLDANQCEAIWMRDGVLHFTNEQRDVYAVREYLARKPVSMLPPRVLCELPMESAAYELDGTGNGWRTGAFNLPVRNIGETEHLRWMISGARLLIAGSLSYEGSFTSSSERGNKWGTGLWLGFTTQPHEELSGKEALLFIGDNGETGLDVWTLTLDKGVRLTPAIGVEARGKVSAGVMSFEVSLPLTMVLGEGKLPQTFLANAWGRNLKGRTEPHLSGTSLYSMTRPYTWADVTIKEQK